MKTIEFTSRPRFRDAVWSVASKRKPGIRNREDLQPLAAIWNDVAVDPEHVAAYRDLCAYEQSDPLPFFYPHVLASPVQIALLTQPEFPVGLLGAVHIRQHAIRYQALSISDRYEIAVRTDDVRFTKRGVEFDLDTDLSLGDDLVWQERMTFLIRQKSVQDEPSKTAALFDWDLPTEPWFRFDVPKNIGRSYSKVSRDFNPIHISNLLAKPFGFKRAIAHGMWNLARVTAPISEDDDRLRIDAEFKGPSFIPSAASVCRSNGRIAVYAPGDDRAAMKINVRRDDDASWDLS